MRSPFLLLAIAWAAAIFTVSSFSSPPGAETGEWASYVAHGVEYGVLGLLVALYFGGRLPRWRVGQVAGAAWAVAAAYGVTDEFHQAFVPGRDASVLDWLADVVGAGVGSLVGGRLRR